MNDERFMKHYVKIVNSTLTESVLRNVNLQANANFIDDLIGELNTENESLKLQIQEMGEQLKKIIDERDMTVGEKQKQNEEFIRNKQEVESVKSQLSHLDTFRNQLIETQKTVEVKDREINSLRSQKDSEINSLRSQKDSEIVALKSKIEELQSPPVTKRKKIGVLNTPVEVDTLVDTTIKDGGLF